MPCTYTGSIEGDRIMALEERITSLTEVTDLLCSSCTRLEAIGQLSVLPPEVRSWWKEHKRIDAKREREEKERETSERAKRRRQYETLRKEFEK